ncbi:MAG: Lrp/AsnC ligand binding domain-containing protein [Desulfurococcales archaeon]|nr:Lrp/AsnC ligand binding domain-containing protein [Desulfurococcales archaeon]MCE4614832.1 Lrp/AsnC ligand binding domain-containing protein [Desulfurococcales archaeon]MEB3755502.1 Lrp/AsnC ligand binding domain-containing protein [Desulfurococcales archaeon]MEB3845726.1 Lrp/AsnC ligand binding domain-containing protein [Desulfurococcales archaeon]
MASAIVLINVEIGEEENAFNKLKEIPEVDEVYMVYGVYDLIAKVEAPDMTKLKEIIADKIRRMPAIRSTLTMMVVEGYKKG